jgi:hypothetical protein
MNKFNRKSEDQNKESQEDKKSESTEEVNCQS